MGKEGCQEQCMLHGSMHRDQGGNHERNQGIRGDALRSDALNKNRTRLFAVQGRSDQLG
jgi:hypothetical protein